MNEWTNKGISIDDTKLHSWETNANRIKQRQLSIYIISNYDQLLHYIYYISNLAIITKYLG